MTTANVTQTFSEILGFTVDPSVEITQTFLEVLGSESTPAVNITQTFSMVIGKRKFLGPAIIHINT